MNKLIAKIYKPFVSMNQTESAYGFYLEALKRDGKIVRYDFEPVKLRLADATYYTPDFRVVAQDGTIEFHEVKGFWRDDARVKIKVAAEMHPYRFLAVKKTKSGWEHEEI